MAQAERFSIIQRLLNAQRSVSFTTLQQRLGMSRATLYRDLRDLRDRLGVPIVFDRDTGRYALDRQAERYEVPGIWFSSAEIHALLSTQQLLVAFDGEPARRACRARCASTSSACSKLPPIRPTTALPTTR